MNSFKTVAYEQCMQRGTEEQNAIKRCRIYVNNSKFLVHVMGVEFVS